MDQLKTSLKVHTVCTVHAPLWWFSAVGFDDKPGHEFDSSHWLSYNIQTGENTNESPQMYKRPYDTAYD